MYIDSYYAQDMYCATNPDYIKENIVIFDFELSDDEMQAMRSLNKEKRFYVSSLEQLERLISRFPTN